MPKYALLAATGATGSAILQCLLSEPPRNLQLNILVRSKTKLLKTCPELENIAAPVAHIIEASSTDLGALVECLRGVETIFMCIGTNESRPGTSLSQDSVRAIIAALRKLRTESNESYRPPTILQLRSASLNPVLARHVPWLVMAIVSYSLHYNHLDMKSACQLYDRAAADQLLEYIYVDPPTIHDAFGKQRTGYRIVTTEGQATALGYADLGAAFCELALRRTEYVGMAVGVHALGKVKRTWAPLAGYLLDGAKARFIQTCKEWFQEAASRPAKSSFFFLIV